MTTTETSDILLPGQSTVSSIHIPSEHTSWLKRLKNEHFANLRPLKDFVDKNRIQPTLTFSIIRQRWNYNLHYFSVNYLIILCCLAAYAVMTNAWLLFTMTFIVGGYYGISRINGPFSIGSTTITPSTLYTSYIGITLTLLLFSGATNTLFWILGASAVTILGHAALLEPGIEGDFGDVQV
ncbi:PRA1 family protein-domain-containing protein [Radiomyces spectabilis]|uniref:PRA1 family protein-domain-containing protein n=1 Tax=Radiomyces spectabilis TaxID=64574 RepID=UPI002220E426|nr:PRA1 family protein-domain-containing protein [Radiomyces spectabilis]KAI8379111.1 PRA1 family protein-domain-containing protein [Radiomyces spectabilis]